MENVNKMTKKQKKIKELEEQVEQLRPFAEKYACCLSELYFVKYGIPKIIWNVPMEDKNE